MQSKKVLSIISLALCATMLTACGGVQKISFSEYWQKNADAPVSGTETLVYTVEHKEEDGLGYDYSVKYTEGTYTTVLTRTTDTETNAVTYTYKTDLQIKVTYTIGSESRTYDDWTKSEVVFQDAGHGLTPISSTKDFSNHLIANRNITSFDFLEKNLFYDCLITTTYGETNKCVVQNRELKNPQDANEGYKYEALEKTITRDGNYSYIDNEQILLALRGINGTLNRSATFESYAPLSAEMQKINVSFDSAEAGNFTFALENAASAEKEVNYYPVSMTIQSNTSRETQTLKIAKATSGDNNTYRNVILELTDPLHYNFGDLVYKLTSADFIS